VSGRLPPGSRLIETEIAAHFKISRTPVRTALDRLEREGYVATPPGLRHSLSQVAEVSRDDAIELFNTLAALEGACARQAAALEPAARRRLAAAMRAVNRKLRAASRKRNPQHHLLDHLDHDFHSLLIDAGAGPRLATLLDMIRPQAARYDQLYAALLAHQMLPSLEEHGRLIRAIERGDVGAAERAAQANQRNAGQRLARAIEAFRGPGAA